MKLIFRLILLSLTAVLFCSISYSQPKEIKLEDAIRSAIQNNSGVKIAGMNVKKANAAVNEAIGYALPDLNLSAQYYRFVKKPKMPFPDFESLLTNATYGILFEENVIPRDNSKFRPVNTVLQSFVQTNNYEASIQLTQTLFSSTVFRGIGSSGIYYELAKQDYFRVVSKTILSAQQAFYGALLSKKLLDISAASLVNAEENLKNVKALYEQGFVSEYDALQAEVQVENIRPNVTQMENLYKDTIEKLKIVMGVDQTEEIRVAGEFTYEDSIIPSAEDIVSEALNSNNDILTLQLKTELDDAFIDLYRAEYWPNIAAFGNFTMAGSSDDFKFQNYSSATIGIGLSMNLFTGLKTNRRVEQSTLTYLQTEEELRQAKEFIASEVKNKLNELARVKSSINVQRRNVELAEKAYSIALVRYKEGTGSQLEVQNADISLRQARTNLIRSVHSYTVTKFELDQLVGKTNSAYSDMINHYED